MKFYITAVLFFFSALLCYADEYYESNILGMKLKPLNMISESETEYVLQINSEKGVETRCLLKDAEIISKTEIVREGNIVTEKTVKENETEIITRENGIIVSEYFEYADGRKETVEYSYNDRQLEYCDVFSDGVGLYHEEYRYTDEGRLLDVIREYSDDGNSVGTSFVFHNGRISGYWMNTGDVKNYIRFDSGGIVVSELYGEGVADETREYFRLSDGKSSEIVTDVESGEVNKSVFNNRGKVIESFIYNGEGELLSKTDYSYDEDYLVSMKIRSELSLELYIFERDNEGVLEKETFYKNGVLVQETEYLDEDNYERTLFRGGKAVLKITFSDGLQTDIMQLQE